MTGVWRFFVLSHTPASSYFFFSWTCNHCVLLSSLSTDITMAKGCIMVTKYFLFLFNLIFFVSNILLLFFIKTWFAFPFRCVVTSGVNAGVSSVKALLHCVPMISRRLLVNPHTYTHIQAIMKATWCPRPVAVCYMLPPHWSIAGDTQMIVL